MKSTIPSAGVTGCRPAGDFENKTSTRTAPKLGLGLGAELGNIENISKVKKYTQTS